MLITSTSPQVNLSFDRRGDSLQYTSAEIGSGFGFGASLVSRGLYRADSTSVGCRTVAALNIVNQSIEYLSGGTEHWRGRFNVGVAPRPLPMTHGRITVAVLSEPVTWCRWY